MGSRDLAILGASERRVRDKFKEKKGWETAKPVKCLLCKIRAQVEDRQISEV